jgi:hypothetical protein
LGLTGGRRDYPDGLSGKTRDVDRGLAGVDKRRRSVDFIRPRSHVAAPTFV